MSSHNDIYIYTVTDAGRTRRLASLLPEADIRQNGLKSYAIVGEFTQQPGEDEVFVVNPAYIEFLTWAIAKHLAHCPGLVEEAQIQQNGHMLITDARGRAHGHELTTDDVIGKADIKDGKLIRYAGNKNYRPFNHHGFMVIEPWLNLKIREELAVQVTLPEKVS